MNKDFNFYRCYLEKEQAVDGEPGLLAATEVVRAVCDAGFQSNGFYMRCYPSSPHCYYKFAKTPREGMYMLRAVKRTDMTTLDILIDTRLYPCFVMIEKNTDWQEETAEVIVTLEQMINEEAAQYNWHVNLLEYRSNKAQHLDEFISALNYMYGPDDEPERHRGHVQIGQLILKVNGNNYYNDEKHKENHTDFVEEEVPQEPIAVDAKIAQELKPLFYNNEADVRLFLKEIGGMPPNDITDLVNQWVTEKRISDYGNSRKGTLWEILKDAGLYTKSRQNWNRRVY